MFLAYTELTLGGIEFVVFIPNSNGPLSSSIQKRIIRAFKFLGFRIDILSNIKIVNFLDVTLDLSNNSYKPFMSSFFSICFVSIHVVHPYSSIDTTTAWKKLRFILSVWSDFHIIDSLLIAVHAFVNLVSMSFSVDETLLPR